MLYPQSVAQWNDDSNYLIVLSSPDPLSHVPKDYSNLHDGKYIVVREPDYEGNPVTAVAFLPDPYMERSLSSLPLALKGARML